ncbi:MAG: EscS/YscS/HrcS family type III secretion system export apparatus protein [Candidatus Tectomicrobia bacterium RIFCSPLOWO2_12_FULL_69_37]|nr:MAG: EscS/YscS/HrcS family type III secretion system export apparatus protein [Candidatus Tectomicrobia bacterium RIFCSPLOWO2_12_FULL_69_37]OGL64269.1 MAG: EscS/YscS/HrcS family type III secretion system export apparatus protein [Candidatus Tectomicrobia bacterium RIFCSPLOWO2_02_FULL_70_19]
MGPDTVLTLVQGALEVMLKLSGPILVGGLVVGILVGIVQAVTQIQEMTLTFIPKILITVIIALVAFPWMLHLMMDYTTNLFQAIPKLVR